MSTIGKVDSLWRYPVKSMRGEELDEAFLGFSGVYGDRLFAFTSSAAPKGFPFLTGREQQEMLRYRPRFRSPDKAARPVNLAEAEKLAPGATPVYAQPAELMVDVETPSGKVFAIDDPALLRMLGGRSLRLGSKAVISILERDPRCKMITLDPDTGESDPKILRQVAQAHDATAGVYSAVLVEGMLRKGDAVELLD